MLDWNNLYDRGGDEFRYMVIFVTVRPKMGSLDYYKDYKETEKEKEENQIQKVMHKKESCGIADIRSTLRSNKSNI